MSTAYNQHMTRLFQSQVTSKQLKPSGNYHHGEHQWGVVAAINNDATPTVDLYLDGAQNVPTDANLTQGIAFLSSYVPTVGDVVLVRRGDGRNRTDRVVLGKLGGSASPYPVPLGNIDPPTGRFVQGPNALWGGTGQPASHLGITGDYYFRSDSPGTDNQEIYVKTNTGWMPSLGSGGVPIGVTQLIAGANVTLSPPTGQGVVTINATTQSTFPTTTGSGSPVARVTGLVGASYQDTDTGAIYLKTSSSSTQGWVLVSGPAVDAGVTGVHAKVLGSQPGVAIFGESAQVVGQKLVAVEVGPSALGGAGAGGLFLATGPSGPYTDTIATLGVPDSLILMQAVTAGSTVGSSTIVIESTATTGGVQISGAALELISNAGGVQIKSLGHGPASLFVYPGNPNTHVSASAKGDLCIDTTTPAMWQASASGTAGWVVVGGGGGVTQLLAGTGISLSPSGGTGIVTVSATGGTGSFPTFTGTGTPNAVVTPIAIGDSYQDTTTGAIYLANALTSADWVTVGGNGDTTISGFASFGDGTTVTGLGVVTLASVASSIAVSGYGIHTVPPLGTDSVTMTAAFGQVALGTPQGNFTASDLLITVVVPVTSAASGFLVKGVDSIATPATGQATPAMTITSEQYITITAWVPIGQYLLIDTSGTIVCGTPVTTAEVF